MSTCCLCTNLTSSRNIEPWNRPLAESPNFVVLPSLGSLVEGWLLLVPKQHYICTGALRADLAEEMQRVKTKVASQVAAKYGPVCAFEHGPGEAHCSVGCGVDHAHLHIVPLAFALRTAASPFLPADAFWSAAGWEECRAAYESGLDYLYLEQPLGEGLISVHREFGSQVFRKAIAACIGVPEQFSWREHPRPDVAELTIQELAGALTFAEPSDGVVPAK